MLMTLVLVPHSKSPKKSLIGAHKAVCHCSSLGRLSCPPFMLAPTISIPTHKVIRRVLTTHVPGVAPTSRKANISPVLRLLNCFLKVPGLNPGTHCVSWDPTDILCPGITQFYTENCLCQVKSKQETRNNRYHATSS